MTLEGFPNAAASFIGGLAPRTSLNLARFGLGNSAQAMKIVGNLVSNRGVLPIGVGETTIPSRLVISIGIRFTPLNPLVSQAGARLMQDHPVHSRRAVGPCLEFIAPLNDPNDSNPIASGAAVQTWFQRSLEYPN